MKEHQRKYQSKIPRCPYYIRVKVPTVIQMEAVECGAAALCSVIAYYKKFITLEQLRIDCGVTRDGVSAFGIKQAAEKYKLLADAHSVELEELYNLPLPLIAFWNFAHFVVIEGFSRDKVYIMDPAIGSLSISYEDLNANFTGLVILFEPGMDFIPSGQSVSFIDSLVGVFKREPSSFIYASLVGLGLVLPQIALPALSQIFIDNIIVGHIYNWLEWLLFSMCLIIALIFGLKFLELNILSRLFIKLTTTTAGEYLWHILRLPYTFYLQRYPGEIANRIVFNENAYKNIATQLSALVIDAAAAAFFGIVMFYYDVWIALFGLSMIAADLILMRYLYLYRLDSYYYFQQTISKSIAYSMTALESIESIKSISNEFSIFSRWAGYYTKALNASQIMGTRDIYAGTIPAFLQMLTGITVICFGAWRVIHGSLTIGMLFAMTLLMQLLMAPVTRLVNFIQLAQFIKVDIARLNDVLDHPIEGSLVKAEKEDEVLMSSFPYPKLKGSLEIKNISFGYDKTGDPILRNIDLSISPGSMVGIIGKTGSGKSTLAKLIVGLFEPWKGCIEFDNKPRKELPRSILISSIGVVEQESQIFFGTVKENIAFFNPLIAPQEIIRAAKDACIHEQILLRKGGYELYLHNNGSNLSGGEKQRLEIARALAIQPSILILDEATSSLDTDTEQNVIENIRRRGCTCVMIAHRISSTRFCDEIIVLEKGMIIHKGSPEDLLKIEGLYKTFYNLEQLS